MIRSQLRTGRERRTECRYRMNAPTLVKSKIGGLAAALVLEASSSGLSVSLPFSLPVNSEVEIRLDNKTVTGFIRNCVCIRAMEFQAGIEVPPITSTGDSVLSHLRHFARAKELNMYSYARATRVWSSPL